MRARTQADLFPIEQDLGKINAPALIIWGAEDALIPLEAGRKMNSLVKGSKLVIIEKCGHVPQEEMPERIVDEIEKFIAEPNKENSIRNRNHATINFHMSTGSKTFHPQITPITQIHLIEN
jgi:fermentation-respiration switch protein FrsA (DUF1100 family)